MERFQTEAPGSLKILVNFNNCPGCLTDYNYAHDKFNVVLPNGTSFDFIIDNQYGNIVYQVSDGRQVKISYSLSSQNIVSFTIIDEDGVKYTFDAADYPVVGPYPMKCVLWILTRIDLPNSTEPVLLGYNGEMQPQGTSCGEYALVISDYHKAHYNETNQTILWGTIPIWLTDQRSMYLMLTNAAAYFISFGKSLVTLSFKNATSVGSRQIDKIQIREDQTLIREIGFATTLQGNATYPCFTYPLAGLDAVTIKGPDNAAPPLTYECLNLHLACLAALITGVTLPNQVE